MAVNSSLNGVKVWLHALGCRSNLCEGEFLAGDITSRGGVICDEPASARAAVIVTCSVTAEADRKCRQLIRRARREMGDGGIIAVCGCWAQGADAETARELGVDVLTGSRGKHALTGVIEDMIARGRTFRDLRPSFGMDGKSWEWEELPAGAPVLHTRAFVKVQDGCDHFCSYCIIPFLRGLPVSRPLENVLDEARRITEAGCREIVLTGICLGLYGRGMGLSLADLIRELSEIPGLERLRLGSLEPFSLNGDLLRAMAESPVFCPHLHLPAQSGDDGILALMRRGYTADDFVRVCDSAREYLGGDLHISSDIIVGFPGESETAFRNTLTLVRRAGLGRIHVFPFSSRPGTAAVHLPDKVPASVADARVSEVSALGAELLTRFAERFTGRELNVLIESGGTGHTANFLEAEFDEGSSFVRDAGSIVKMRVSSCRGGILTGSPA